MIACPVKAYADALLHLLEDIAALVFSQQVPGANILLTF
jgi:hypothetical protein